MSVSHELYSPSKNSLDKALEQCKWRNIYFDCHGKGHLGTRLHETMEKAKQILEKSLEQGAIALITNPDVKWDCPEPWPVKDYRWAIQIPIMERK